MSIRPAALAAFDLQEDELSTDLVVSQAAVVDRGWMDHQEQPVDQNAPEADRRNVPEEVISVSDGEVDRESTIGGGSSQASCSTTSSDEDSDISEPARSEVSVQDSIMEHAYHSLQNAFTVEEGQLVGGDGTLNQLELLPFHWPLAKLTLPLKFGVNRLEGLVVGFLMELMATRSEPWLYRRQISSFAKTLTVRVATYLAKEIASLFRPVLQHPVMALTDDDTLSLLTSDFWIRPVYEELLYAASRFNRSSGAEHKRPTSNLVKIASFSKDKTSDMMNAGINHTTMTEWIGADCPVDFLTMCGFQRTGRPLCCGNYIVARRHTERPTICGLTILMLQIFPGSKIKERMHSVVGNCSIKLVPWIIAKICPRSWVSSRLIGLTFRWTTFYSNSLPSRMVFFVGFLSNKLLALGMAVVLRKLK